MSVSEAISAVDPHDTRRPVMAIVASSSGSLVEWYDFYAYSFFSLYFAHHFFPSEYVGLSFKNAGAEGGFYWYVAALMAVALVAVICMPDPRRLRHMEHAPP